MKTYILNSDITLTEEQMRDIAEAYNKPKFEYPIFKRAVGTGEIVMFTDIKVGTVLWRGKDKYSIGHTTDGWAPHTDKEVWEDIPYDRDRDLLHGQPIFCWDNDDSHQRVIRFYDAINKCTFRWKGTLNGATFHNYEAIPQNEYKDWMIEAFNTLDWRKDET